MNKTTPAYHCTICDQTFRPEDTVTKCPNSDTGAHNLEVLEETMTKSMKTEPIKRF